jgi:cold shock CspA family protein
MNDQRIKGKVQNFEHGWGFIAYEIKGKKETIFVHHTNIDMEGYRDIFPEDDVTFVLGLGPNGRMQAMVVRVEEESTDG